MRFARGSSATAGLGRRANADAAAALFTEDAVYRSSPFRDPHLGREGIRDYWANATGTQTSARVLIGRPVVEGDRVAVEW